MARRFSKVFHLGLVSLPLYDVIILIIIIAEQYCVTYREGFAFNVNDHFVICVRIREWLQWTPKY